MTEIIRFENVCKSYTTDEVILNDISFSINKSEFICLLGLSGCGKTTILKLINKLLLPTSGVILFNGQDVSTIDSVKYRRELGYVIQDIGLMPHWTIRRNLLTEYEINGDKLSKKDAQSKCTELMNLVNLPLDYLDKYPHELSGGQQQRVGIARALAKKPDVVLMDEPFGALDNITRTELQDELIRIKETLGTTFIFVTHDISEAFKLSDRIMLINEGVIEQFDTPNNLMRHPASEFVKKFLHIKDSVDVTQLGDELHCIHYKAWKVEANRLMETYGTNILGVLDNNNNLVGIITKRSLSKFMKSDKLMNSLLDANLPSISYVKQSQLSELGFEGLSKLKTPIIVIDTPPRVISAAQLQVEGSSK